MKLTFVNHSSFIIEHDNVKLICDPWMEGKAFHNGWALLSETKLNYSDFESITHIWFSHEHPDHFSPPNLFKIPKEYREKISILYQETTDGKVAKFCSKLGFKEQIELKENQFYKIADDLSVMCNPYTDGDSYALFKSKDLKILNLNDCIVSSENKAKELSKIVGEVDVLFTQFGYANKVGNSGDANKRVEASKEKLRRIAYQDKYLKPKVIVPFASYVYFCHEENAYMNEGMNRISKVHDFIKDDLQKDCLVMHPNDTWKPGDEIDSTNAIAKYAQDYAKVDEKNWQKSEKIELDELVEKSLLFVDELKKGYPKKAKDIENLNTKVYLSDHQTSFILSGKNGLTSANFVEENCDISISSDALSYCFQELWGGDTLNVNARFQIPNNGNYNKFRIFSNIAASLNREEKYPVPSLPVKVMRTLKSFLER